MIRLSQPTNEFFKEELILQVGQLRYLKIRHTGDIHMALLPRRIMRKSAEPVPVPLTDAQRREIAYQKVKDTHEAVLKAETEQADFEKNIQGAGVLDFVHVTEPIFVKDDTKVTLAELSKKKADAVAAFNVAQQEFAREWSF